MDSSSDSDESGGRPQEWEILSSSEANFSDSNNEVGNGSGGGSGSGGGVLHERHFECPPEIPKVAQLDQEDCKKREDDREHEENWVEPSSSAALKHEEQADKETLDMFSSLVTSVLDDGKLDGNIGGHGDTMVAEESLASLQREILSESGMTSLIPSDVHGNVLKPEDEAEEETEYDVGGTVVSNGATITMNGSRYGKLASLARTLRRASTLWSLTIAAAALMGLAIIGRQWHHERWQNQQLRLQLCYKDEKISQLLFQIARLKEAVAGRRRVPVVRSSPM